MRLQFTPEYLEKLEEFALSYHTTRDELIEKIEYCLNDLCEYDIKKAIESGHVAMDEAYEERYWLPDVCIEGFSVAIMFDELHKEDCLNWDDYFNYLLKQYYE